MHTHTHMHKHTHLTEIEVSMSKSVYSVDEAQYVYVCANHTGNIEGSITLNLVPEPGTATGKQLIY